jgi:hypothetical protein
VDKGRERLTKIVYRLYREIKKPGRSNNTNESNTKHRGTNDVSAITEKPVARRTLDLNFSISTLLPLSLSASNDQRSPERV